MLLWGIVNKDGAVVSAHCVCIAGLGETCTHVGVLLFKIEAVVRIREKPTVTGVPAYWVVPTGINKVEPEVGHRTDYTSAAAKKKRLGKAINSGEVPPQQPRTGCTSRTPTPTPTQQEIKDFLRTLHLTGDKAAVLSVVPEYCKDFKDPVDPVVIPRSLRNLHNRNCDAMDKNDLMVYCESVFDRVQISEEEAINVERGTREQHRTPSWFAARAGRITSSQMHSVCTFRMQKPAISTVTSVCYPGQKKINAPAVQGGLQNEE